MAEAALRHKLAAILAADAAGYSRLMQEDEPATIAQLDACRDILRRQIEANHGRVVDMAGDSVLAEFQTATGAVKAGLAAQSEIASVNESVVESRRMFFRVGINLGETIEKADGTIYGDGVNIAARLQALAEPGGVCVSEAVVAQTRGKVDAAFIAMGAHAVKNIAEAIRVYRVAPAGALGKSKRWHMGWPRKNAAVVVFLVAGIGAAAWYFGREVLPQAAPPGAKEDLVLALPQGPSIAVLPFTNLSGDPAQEYFSDGLTEDLITGLSRFRDLLVIGRHSTFQYKGRAGDIRKVGHELGARYVVEGSVRRGGRTVRVNAQLLDANSGTHLWAQTFDRELTVAQLFALQDEITAQIIGAIAGSYGVISRTQREAAVAAGTANLEAYDCVLQAYAYEQILTQQVHAATRSCLERAVQLDPAYADAWSKLAFLYADEYAWGYNPRPRSLDRALDAAQRAVELDPSSGMTHWHLARTHFWRNEVEEAVTEAERALALNPNNAFVLAAAGTYMAPTAGDNLKRGVQLTSKALRIDPNPPGWYYVPQILFHYDKLEYEAALVASLKMNMPKFFHAHMWRSAIYGQLGRSSDAAASNQKLLQLYPTFAKNARHELTKFNVNPALADHIIDGLRKAGLEIPEQTR